MVLWLYGNGFGRHYGYGYGTMAPWHYGTMAREGGIGLGREENGLGRLWLSA
jgi:hypothetical protein